MANIQWLSTVILLLQLSLLGSPSHTVFMQYCKHVLEVCVQSFKPLSCHNPLQTPFVLQPHRNVFGLSWVVIHNLWFYTLSALDQIYFPQPMAAFVINNACLGEPFPLTQSLIAGLGPVPISCRHFGRPSQSLIRLPFGGEEWLTTLFLLEVNYLNPCNADGET